MTAFFEMLGLPLMVSLVMLAMLGFLGLHVLKREVIFIDISLAQVSALGAVLAHLVLGVHDDSVQGFLCAFALTLLAALFYSFARKKISQIPLEAVIGVSYAVAAAGVLFVVGIFPGGHVHVQEMLAGSILWSTGKDLLMCSVLFSLVGICFFLFRHTLGKISESYENAQKEGINVFWWDFLFYALLGTVITLCVRIGGVVVVFALLIMPATLSALFSARWKKRLFITWTAGAAAILAGFIFASRLDFSVGPSVALFLGIELILAGSFCRLTKKYSATD